MICNDFVAEKSRCNSVIVLQELVKAGPSLCKKIISKLNMKTNQILGMNNKIPIGMNMRRNSSTDNFTGTPDLIEFSTFLLFYVTVAVQVPIKTQCASQVANYVKQMSLT